MSRNCPCIDISRLWKHYKHMRIIGGTLKGKSLLTPPEFKARPTTDVAKEALFNILDK